MSPLSKYYLKASYENTNTYAQVAVKLYIYISYENVWIVYIYMTIHR